MSRDTIQLSIVTVLNKMDSDVPVWVYIRHSDSRVDFNWGYTILYLFLIALPFRPES